MIPTRAASPTTLRISRSTQPDVVFVRVLLSSSRTQLPPVVLVLVLLPDLPPLVLLTPPLVLTEPPELLDELLELDDELDELDDELDDELPPEIFPGAACTAPSPVAATPALVPPDAPSPYAVPAPPSSSAPSRAAVAAAAER